MIKNIIERIKFKPFVIVLTLQNKENIKQRLIPINYKNYKKFKKILGIKNIPVEEFKFLMLNSNKIKEILEKEHGKKEYKIAFIDILE